MPSELANQVVVIIGGTTGLGLSAARALVSAGARVVVVGRTKESADLALAELGSAARTLVGDATQPETAVNAIRIALDSFGGFHSLYHVAGGSGRKMGDGPLHEITDAGWTATLDLNLKSLFFSNRAAIQQFLKQGGGGAILNMGSVLGQSPSPRFFSTHAYATAKAAIVGLSQSAAAYYAPQNIRINVIAPALVATPMSRRAQENTEILNFIRTKQPLDGGRIGRPEDLDAAAIFLLSPAARFVTGQVLAVDGGWTLSEGQYDPA